MKRERTLYDDGTRYVVRLDSSEYFEKFESTPWDTVKVFVRWTRDSRKAYRWSLPELLAPGSGYSEALVAGFAGVRLCEVRGSQFVPLVPVSRQPPKPARPLPSHEAMLAQAELLLQEGKPTRRNDQWKHKTSASRAKRR